MASVERLLTNLSADNLEECKDFYLKLFDFKVNFNSDWFSHLLSADGRFELGIIQRNHELVPVEFQGISRGTYITFVVGELEELEEKVKKHHFDIVDEPRDLFYGQRRMLLRDPAGNLVDVSAPMKM